MWWIAMVAGCEREATPADPCADGGEPGVLCTVIGTGANGFNGRDLPAAESWLFYPSAAAFDPDGRYVLDDFNNWRIVRLEDDGLLKTIAGNGLHYYASDGAPAVSSPLENPVDIAYGPDGLLYISELHGARVLRVTADGLVDTYVGSELNPGYPGYSGDGGPALDAEMSEAYGIAFADDGTLYVADTGNNCVRAVGTDGIISGLAGGGPKPGFADGIGSEAAFHSPRGLTVSGGYLYVADAYNHAIRRIDRLTGEVTTVAGTGVPGFGGDGGPAVDALLTEPVGVTVGPDGLLYVADAKNHVIRRIDGDGVIDTVLGQPQVDGFAGDGLPVADGEALLNWPNEVQFSADGDLYVIDTWNARVRRVRGFLAE